jgi:hypothetical protein
VSHGTVIDEMPSNSATIGANAKIMMVSFSATCDSHRSSTFSCHRSVDACLCQAKKNRGLTARGF